MGNTFFFEWEPALIEWLQAHIGSAGTAIASFISNFGEELFLVAILGFLYWSWDKKKKTYTGTITDILSSDSPMSCTISGDKLTTVDSFAERVYKKI